jgi:lincosamide nucleotidyltransferase A/C/D/E
MAGDTVEVASPGMPPEEVHLVLDALRTAGFDRFWVGGGWGVDALAGRQTRPHRDLDLAVDVTRSTLDQVIDALAGRGYAVETDWRPVRVELSAPASRWVDVHPLAFDEHGVGHQANAAGQAPFVYPPEGFARGDIGGRPVDCLSVAQQLTFHSGYSPRAHDLLDIALLEAMNRQLVATRLS